MNRLKDVGQQQHPAFASNSQCVIGGEVESGHPRRPLPETVHGFDTGSAWSFENLAVAVVERVGRKRRQRRARERIEADPEVHADIGEVVAIHLPRVASIERQRSSAERAKVADISPEPKSGPPMAVQLGSLVGKSNSDVIAGSDCSLSLRKRG